MSVCLHMVHNLQNAVTNQNNYNHSAHSPTKNTIIKQTLNKKHKTK